MPTPTTSVMRVDGVDYLIMDEAARSGVSALNTRVDNVVSDVTQQIANITGNGNIEFDDNMYVNINYATTTLVEEYSTDYRCAIVECSPGTKFTVSLAGGSVRAYGFVDASLNVLEGPDLWIGVNGTLTAPANTKYCVINDYGKTGSAYIGDYVMKDRVDQISSDIVGWNIQSINRFNKDDPNNVDGYTLDIASGLAVPQADYFNSDFIDVSDLSKISCSYVHILCFYNSLKEFISGLASTYYEAYDERFALPTGTKYVKLSTKLSYKALTQIGSDVKRSDYKTYNDVFLFEKLKIKEREIVVAPSGGDYSSFTAAVYNTIYSGINIRVKAGTYNIVNEYKALFGDSVVANLSDATDLSNFQYGVYLNNRKVIFEPGAYLVCDWTGHTVDGTHRFSAIAVGSDVEIVGMDLDCTATFYAIHDDYGDWNYHYTNTYRDCRIIGHSLTNQNAIGGGCKPYSKHVLERCWFEGGTVTVRYHNTFVDAYPVLEVHNCYFSGTLGFCYYGSQTTKMRAYVSNCKATAISKWAEVEGSTDNVEIYKWCNEEGDNE